MAKTFVIVLTICTIMGLIDLDRAFMPGFRQDTYPMSMQFGNANYSSYIIALAVIMCLWFAAQGSKTLGEKLAFWLCHLVLNVGMFVNGCFSGEVAMLIAEFVLFIALWIKHKKCPWRIILAMLTSIIISFAIYLFPTLINHSTAGACFLYEGLAVFDHYFDTNLLYDVSSFIARLTNGGSQTGAGADLKFGDSAVLYTVVGSDGWDRKQLMENAWKTITDSPKNFLFGAGMGTNYEIRVHNVYVQIWLEQGFISLLLYLSVLVYLIVLACKKIKKLNLFAIVSMFMFVLVIHNLGCQESYSFEYFIMLLAYIYKTAKMDKNSSKSNAETAKTAEILEKKAEIISEISPDNDNKTEERNTKHKNSKEEI